MNAYLIKRSPDLTPKGIIIKRNSNSKGYTEARINRIPSSDKLEVNDIIYVAESSYGIYAKGVVKRKHDIISFSSIHEILEYFTSNNLKDSSYFISLMERLNKAKKNRSNTVLYFQKFEIVQQLLDNVIHFNNELSSLRKIRASFSKIDPSLITFLENPIKSFVNELNVKIPNSLRLDLYSLFNRKYNISTWIDIDHFVPQSVGGPGNILENLVPIGFSLNRYKNASIPKGLFKVAENEYPDETRKYISQDIRNDTSDFLKSRDAKENARKIVDVVNNKPIQHSRQFYKKVLEYHHPEYIKIIEVIQS